MAVINGTSVITSMANREPIKVYDLNRNRSPNRKPISPEIKSQNQASPDASKGRNNPLVMLVKILRKSRPINKRMILTESDPTFKLACSKAKAVIVQKTAVNNAAISPV